MDMSSGYPASILPPEYHILPESIDFIVPDFLQSSGRGSKTLALRQRDCREWFYEFAEKVSMRCGHQFLPICRMSDGEFKFALGEQASSKRLPQLVRSMGGVMMWWRKYVQRSHFTAATARGVSSGKYSFDEWHAARVTYPRMIRKISHQGILALHLSYTACPFQEHYFPALNAWLQHHNITLTEKNYYPFYFVYALLAGPWREKLLKNRRVLVVHGAQGKKRQNIEVGLRQEGIADLFWCSISPDRSLFDTIDVSPYRGKVDLGLVGAGIGKPNILLQMESLKIPCIDAGYVFEVWADSLQRKFRAFCTPDTL